MVPYLEQLFPKSLRWEQVPDSETFLKGWEIFLNILGPDESLWINHPCVSMHRSWTAEEVQGMTDITGSKMNKAKYRCTLQSIPTSQRVPRDSCSDSNKHSAAAVQGKGHFVSQQQGLEAHKAADPMVAPQFTIKHWCPFQQSQCCTYCRVFGRTFQDVFRDWLKKWLSPSVLAEEKATYNNNMLRALHIA